MSSEWLEWYYLIYLLPAAVAIFVLLMSGLAGHDGGHTDGGADMHMDAHFHADPLHAHFGDAHAHAHLGHDAGHHGDVHADGDGPGALYRLLGFFGVGRAPLTIVVGSLMIGWGLCGLAATAVLREMFPGNLSFIPFAGVAAGFGALFTAKVFGELTARLMPGDESFAVSRNELVGLTGTVIYPVSDELGRIHVWDRNRTLHAESSRLADPGPPIERGTAVLITAMDPSGRYLLVRPVGPAPSSASTAATNSEAA